MVAAAAATVEVAGTMAAATRAATTVVAVGRSTTVMAMTTTMTVAATVLLADHDQLSFFCSCSGWMACLSFGPVHNELGVLCKNKLG